MKIGIIGMGKVGETVAFGLKRIDHEIIGFDKDLTRSTHTFPAIFSTQLVFICVPTPMDRDGKCDTSSVQEAVKDLAHSGYRGLVVVKSTVPPGTTDQLARDYPGLRIAFCPEFLRERARFSDFYENHELCIIGVSEEPWQNSYGHTANGWTDAVLIEQAHGNIPKRFAVMTRTEAELAKYFVNCFNAYRINFANAFYDVCQKLGADYSKIKDAVTKRTDTKSSYLDSNAQFRAFGGACLPKDTRAFAEFVASLGVCTRLFETIVVENAENERNVEVM